MLYILYTATMPTMHAHEILLETYVHIPPLWALEQLSAEQAERCVPGASHSIAEIVAHMTFWQAWLCDRCEGTARPMAASAAAGWPTVAHGSWVELHARFAAGLQRAVAFGDRADQPVLPPIEFPPLAHYTVRDALTHIAQHNSHHLGQVVLLRQIAGLWPPPAGSWTW